MVFYINGIVYLAGGTFYLLFASGEKQLWANGTMCDKLSDIELTAHESKEE